MVIFRFGNKNTNKSDDIEAGKINGKTVEEIDELSINEYNEFVSNVSESEIEKVTSRPDISEYVSLETEDFKIENFEEENKTLKEKEFASLS